MSFKLLEVEPTYNGIISQVYFIEAKDLFINVKN